MAPHLSKLLPWRRAHQAASRQPPRPNTPQPSRTPSPNPASEGRREPPNPEPATGQPNPPAQRSQQPPDVEHRPNVPGQLWLKAYNSVDKKLVKDYEDILDAALGSNLCGGKDDSHGQKDAETTAAQMAKRVEAGLQKICNEAAVKHKIGEGMRLVSSVKDVVGNALKYSPEASTAWGGVCLLLQVLENPIAESKALLDGTSYVVSRLDWYWHLSSRLFDDRKIQIQNVQEQLENHVVDLFRKFLEYQMNAVCSFRRHWAATAARDIVKFDGWAGALESIKEEEKLVQQDIDRFCSDVMRDLLGNIAKEATNQRTLLQAILHTMENTAKTDGENRQKEEENRRKEKEMERNQKCKTDLFLTDPRADKARIARIKGGLFRGASDWILDHNGFNRWRNADTTKLLWIKGAPGKGKTMLLVTIIDELEKELREQQRHVAPALSYFFCQATDTNLDNAVAVLRGLIYLLCERRPQLISHLRKRYDDAEAKLFQCSNALDVLGEALDNMICDPTLGKAYFIIDALDECGADRDWLLRRIVHHAAASPHIKWIVSSRNIPEIENLLVMQDGSDSEVKLSLEVAENATQVTLAVNAFIDHKLGEIPSLRKNPDTKSRIRDILRDKADGTFLWVALVAQELAKAKRLQILQTAEKVPATLTEFYSHMMDRIRHQDEDLDNCQRIFSAATLAHRPLHLTELAIVSGLLDEVSDDIDSIQEVVDACGSFLTARDNFVYFIHQSAKDYLDSNAGDFVFPFGPGQVHHRMFSQSVKALSQGKDSQGKAVLRRNIYEIQHLGTPIDNIQTPSPDPLMGLRYSCVYWASHFCDVKSGNGIEASLTNQDFNDIGRFVLSYFLYWLEALSLLKSMSEGVASIRRLESFLQTQPCEPHVKSLIADASRFILHNKHIIEKCPLQTYVSALLFSPSDSTIRNTLGQEPEWVLLKPIVEKSWSPCLQTLEGHSGPVYSVVFSPDGSTIASASHDDTVKLWDRAGGHCLQTLEGHNALVNSVVFSPDGSTIASASHDGTVKLWDRAGGLCLQTFNLRTTSQLLAFESSNSYLLTDASRIKLRPTPGQQMDESHVSSPAYGYGLSTDMRWIAWEGQNMLWLPANCRPVRSAIQSCTLANDLSATMVALGTSGGRVILLVLKNQE